MKIESFVEAVSKLLNGSEQSRAKPGKAEEGRAKLRNATTTQKGKLRVKDGRRSRRMRGRRRKKH